MTGMATLSGMRCCRRWQYVFGPEFRQIDLLGRLGGEEFAVALIETDMPAALEVAERLCREIADEPFNVSATDVQVTVSVGVATRRAGDDNGAQLLKLADRAMYVAKGGGRNRVVANDE